MKASLNFLFQKLNLLDREAFWLSIIYLAIVSTIALRTVVESTHYVSIDSEYYLRVSENIVDGSGIVAPDIYPFNSATLEERFAKWPLGYPAMIGLVSWVTGFPSLVSSKITNVLFLGLVFFLLHFWHKKQAWFIALYFCSYSMLEVYSYTWSEGAFLFLILILVGVWV